MGDKKKSPNSNHAHRTTSHKTEHHWEKIGSHGRNLDCSVCVCGGGRHLRKCSLLNGNQMGFMLLNRIPDLQCGAGAGLGVLSPWPLSVQRGHGGGGGGCQALRLRQSGFQTPGSWLWVSAPLTLPRCLPAICQDLQIRSISKSSTVIPAHPPSFSVLSSNSFSLQHNFKGARKSSLFQKSPSQPLPPQKNTLGYP